MLEGSAETGPLHVLDAPALRRWCTAGLAALTAARAEIDDLNVYPVPDGDTGINLQLTMESVVEAVRGAPADMAATVTAMARGALMGARGNSGVILSQLVRGLAEVLAASPGADPALVQEALRRAAELGYAAVATPAEGTVLTVAREAAAAAQRVSGSLAEVVSAARAGAAEALARTPEQLPALRAAGVVDAGGRGWCVLLEALERVVAGEPDDAGAVLPAGPSVLVPRDRSGLAVARESGSDAFGYEVQYLLADATEESVAQLTRTLAALGDSLVVVGGGQAAPDLHNVHVHVNDVGAAVEAGVQAGRPFRITVTRFADQMAEPGPAAPLADAAGRRVVAVAAGRRVVAVAAGRRVVAVAAGEGIAALLRAGGAQVVEGGPTRNPSTGELLAAVRAGGAAEVVLLPNDGNTVAAAVAAAEEARREGRQVAVVRTRAAVQGLAALAVADPDRPFADDVAAMAEAAGSTRWAEVTTAVRQSMTMAGVCRPGDVLGLIEGDVVVVRPVATDPAGAVEAVARDLLDRMLAGGGELVTLLVGADAAPGLGERVSAHLQRTAPAVEVTVCAGGQPHYPILLGVE